MSTSIAAPAAPAGAAGLVWVPATAQGALPGTAEVGGKAHNLALLLRAGAPVPPFFVLGAAAFARTLGDAGALPDDDAEAERLRARVLAVEADDELRAALREGLAALGEGSGALAVRSSAVGEDGERSSFAGQFETVLGVAAEEAAVWDAVRHVWASAFTAHALRYRRERGETTGAMAVVVQRLVEPHAAGVAFSLDPVSGDRTVAVVSAVLGLGEGLVSGALDADTFRVAFGGGAPRVTAEVVAKERAVRRDPAGGVRFEEVDPALRHAPALSDAEARRIASRARALAASLGAPQDVEWAIAPGPGGPRDLYLLQARPVTAVAAPRPVAGERRVWDNENIVESLPGVTLPLTYSVAGRLFGDVYRQLSEVMEVPDEEIYANDIAFRDLFGLVRGRVLYNRGHRNAILATLPGLRLQGEEIVGAPLPGEPPGTPPLAPGALPAPLILASRALGVPARLLRDTARLDGLLADFRARVERSLDPLATADLSALTVDELREAYWRLDAEVLAHWHGPMLNDSLVEHWMGVLGQMLEMWLPGLGGTLFNQLVAGDGGIVSTEPVQRLAALGERARGDARLLAVLLAEGGDDGETWERLATDPAFAEFGAALAEYLERFGDRCTEELKLEALTYADDPGVLVRMLRRYAALPADAPAARGGAAIRAEAEAVVRQRLAAGHQVAFFAVLERVRRLTRDRENLRFERTRAFGVIRRIFLGIGARLAAGGALDDARDVFYLGEDEVFRLLDGTAPGASLRPLVAARRAEFEAYARLPEPPDRFVTHGPPSLSPIEPYLPPGAPVTAVPKSTAVLRGMGCCPGVVRAPVRIVHDPRHAGDLTGHILVAQQTDPGWTLLFPASAGVLVQRGSILSHAALVAREMGIPCVVGIPDLLSVLKDGETVEMDGATGLVRRIVS